MVNLRAIAHRSAVWAAWLARRAPIRVEWVSSLREQRSALGSGAERLGEFGRHDCSWWIGLPPCELLASIAQRRPRRERW